MSDLSPDAQRLLRDARAFDEPSAADAQRVHASVLAKVGVAVGAGAGITAATTSLAASPIAVLGVTAMKLGAAIVVAGGLATASYVAFRAPSSKPRPTLAAVVEAPKASLPEAPAPEARVQVPSSTNDIAPRTYEAQPPHAKAGRSRRSAPAPVDQVERAPRPTPPDLEGEAHLLEQADADLRRGDAQAALGRLAEHAARYPSGALREEREGIRVVALCRAGREAEGKAAADKFLARSPRSTLAARIRAACGD